MANRSGSGGEYVRKDVAVEESRYRFLEAVRNECPQPLYVLRDDLFPVYQSWFDSVVSEAKAAKAWREDTSAEAKEVKAGLAHAFRRLGMTDKAAEIAAQGRPITRDQPDDPIFRTFLLIQYGAPEVARVLMQWAQQFHLTHTRKFEEPLRSELETTTEGQKFYVTYEETLWKQYWACQWAVETLWAWYTWPKGREMMDADPPEWVRVSFDRGRQQEGPLKVQFEVPHWQIENETEPVFHQRIHNAVDEWLEEYADKRETAVEVMGYQRRQRKYRSAHFEWLALRQVAGLTYEEISKRYSDEEGRPGDDAIRHGVEQVGSLVRLLPRSGRRGPKRRKTGNFNP